MRFLCRLGGHLPSEGSLIDLNSMLEESLCRRCGELIQRSPGTPWQLRSSTPTAAGVDHRPD